LDLLNHLSFALKAFVKLTERSGQRFRGNRINDIGKKFEYMVVKELKNPSFGFDAREARLPRLRAQTRRENQLS
jgi:hypothetical protein